LGEHGAKLNREGMAGGRMKGIVKRLGVAKCKTIEETKQTDFDRVYGIGSPVLPPLLLLSEIHPPGPFFIPRKPFSRSLNCLYDGDNLYSCL